MRSPRREVNDALDWSLRLALKGMVARHRPPREVRFIVIQEASNFDRAKPERHFLSPWLRTLGLIGEEPRPSHSPQVSLEPFATSFGVLALRR